MCVLPGMLLFSTCVVCYTDYKNGKCSNDYPFMETEKTIIVHWNTRQVTKQIKNATSCAS